MDPFSFVHTNAIWILLISVEAVYAYMLKGSTVHIVLYFSLLDSSDTIWADLLGKSHGLFK